MLLITSPDLSIDQRYLVTVNIQCPEVDLRCKNNHTCKGVGVGGGDDVWHAGGVYLRLMEESTTTKTKKLP